jgi:hypothetical protein
VFIYIYNRNIVYIKRTKQNYLVITF